MMIKTKIILINFLFFVVVGTLFAGSDCEGYASAKEVSKTKPEIVLSSNNIQLLKYSDHEGNTMFTIKNLDGKVLAENMSRLRLRIDFPDIEKKAAQKSFAKL